MSEYPLLSIIRKRLKDKQENVRWLANEIDRSERWIDGLTTIEKVNVAELLKLSNALNFDFLSDYWRHIGRTVENAVAEPFAPYQVNAITFSINITGSAEKAGEILKAIQQQGEKMGYKVE